MIQLSNVSKYYHSNGVTSLGLKNINLTLNKGEIVAIIGESGAGKSTLLNVICGVDSYDDGEMYFNGEETSYFNIDDMDNYRKSNVSFIYQNYNIIESYTVLQNVTAPLLLKGMSAKEAENEAKRLIEEVGLSNRIHNKGTQLSGGEKQRCVIARALATDSPILACDEPTGNLDSKTGEEIIELIHKVAKDKLVLIVTHNYAQVENIVTRTLRLHDGEIVEDIRKQEITEEISETPIADESKKKNTFRTSLTIAIQNILAAPKKSFFITIVTTLLSLILLFALMSDFNSADSLLYASQGTYANTLKTRLVVYDRKHNELDYNKLNMLSGEKVYNGWYEDENCYYSIDGMSYTFSVTSGQATYSYVLPKLEDYTGSAKAEEDTEAFIVFTSKDNYEIAKRNLDMDKYPLSVGKDSFAIIGFGYNSDLSRPLIVSHCYKTESSKAGFYLSYYKEDINIQSTISNTDGSKTTVDYYYESYSDSKYKALTLELPSGSSAENYRFEMTVGGLYSFAVTPDVVYTDISNPMLYIPTHFDTDKVYECTVYADDLSQSKKEITDLGYSYSEAAKGKVDKSSVSYISTVFSVFMTIVYGLLVTLIAYVILNKTYSSRLKDFTVLRSLGYLKKQMKGIVNLEMAIYGLFSSAVALLLFWIISLFVPYIASLFGFMNIIIAICYFLIIQLYSLIIAHRFNKKVFQFTVTENLRNGGLL